MNKREAKLACELSDALDYLEAYTQKRREADRGIYYARQRLDKAMTAFFDGVKAPK